MIEIIEITSLDKWIPNVFLTAMILFSRRYLNTKSLRYASMILWTLLFIYLITPYAVQIKLNLDYFTLKKGYLYELVESKVYYSNIFIKVVGRVLYTNNRQIVSLFLIVYIISQIVKTTRVVTKSKVISKNQVMEDYIKLFNLRRKKERLMTYEKIKPTEV